MPAASSYFSDDYVQARDRFRHLASARGGKLHSLQLDARGPSGENLSIDIAVFADADSSQILLHSSGIHGVEGFAGSAIQLQLLDELPHLRDKQALIIVHTLNPYGMAWLRRVNEANVDLNRNCLEDESYSGAPGTYAELDPFLNPKSPPASDAFLLRVIMFVIRYGWPALKQAVAGGQYEYPNGLFFGGKELQPGLAQYRAFLAGALRSAERVIAIDVHTGLGKFGNDVLLVDEEHFSEMSQSFGPRVVPLQPQSGPAYRARGGLQFMIFRTLSHANVAFVGQEFGTYPPLKVVHALREENRWHHYGNKSLDHASKRAMKEIFNPDNASWRESVLKRGRELILQAGRMVWQ